MTKTKTKMTAAEANRITKPTGRANYLLIIAPDADGSLWVTNTYLAAPVWTPAMTGLLDVLNIDPEPGTYTRENTRARWTHEEHVPNLAGLLEVRPGSRQVHNPAMGMRNDFGGGNRGPWDRAELHDRGSVTFQRLFARDPYETVWVNPEFFAVVDRCQEVLPGRVLKADGVNAPLMWADDTDKPMGLLMPVRIS